MKKINLAVGIFILGVLLLGNISKTLSLQTNQKLLLSQVKSEFTLPEFKPHVKPTLNGAPSSTNNTEILLKQAVKRYEAGDYQGAITISGQIIRNESNNFFPYYVRGSAYLKLDNYKRAISDFDQTVRLAPEFPYGYYNRAYVRYQLGNKKGAIADLQKTAEIAKNQGEKDLYKQATNILKNISNG